MSIPLTQSVCGRLQPTDSSPWESSPPFSLKTLHNKSNHFFVTFPQIPGGLSPSGLIFQCSSQIIVSKQEYSTIYNATKLVGNHDHGSLWWRDDQLLHIYVLRSINFFCHKLLSHFPHCTFSSTQFCNENVRFKWAKLTNFDELGAK